MVNNNNHGEGEGKRGKLVATLRKYANAPKPTDHGGGSGGRRGHRKPATALLIQLTVIDLRTERTHTHSATVCVCKCKSCKPATLTNNWSSQMYFVTSSAKVAIK